MDGATEERGTKRPRVTKANKRLTVERAIRELLQQRIGERAHFCDKLSTAEGREGIHAEVVAWIYVNKQRGHVAAYEAQHKHFDDFITLLIVGMRKRFASGTGVPTPKDLKLLKIWGASRAAYDGFIRYHSINLAAERGTPAEIVILQETDGDAALLEECRTLTLTQCRNKHYHDLLERILHMAADRFPEQKAEVEGDVEAIYRALLQRWSERTCVTPVARTWPPTVTPEALRTTAQHKLWVRASAEFADSSNTQDDLPCPEESNAQEDVTQ